MLFCFMRLVKPPFLWGGPDTLQMFVAPSRVPVGHGGLGANGRLISLNLRCGGSPGLLGTPSPHGLAAGELYDTQPSSVGNGLCLGIPYAVARGMSTAGRCRIGISTVKRLQQQRTFGLINVRFQT